MKAHTRRWLLRFSAAIAGFFRLAAGQQREGRAAFVALSAPVRIPATDLSRPWSAVPFTARCAAAAGHPREILLKGAALRVPDSGGGASFKAYCLTCPHEICQVSLTTETRGVETPSERPLPQTPLFVCPCHFSAFDPLADGARLAGPTHRGLYRFRLEARGGAVVVSEIERAALV